jgi:hypothetical protein
MTDAPHRSERPDPNTRPCEDCGHIWFAGERRHEYLDHGAERNDDAEVLCLLCRQERALQRPEKPSSQHWA